MEQEKPKLFSKRNVIALFIVFIMVFGAGGVVVDQLAKESYEYNGIRIVLKNNLWTAKADGKEFVFNYLPTDVEQISMSTEIGDRLANTLELDFTSDADDKDKQVIAYSQFVLSKELEKKGIYFRTGFTGDNEFNQTIIKCNNDAPHVPILYLKNGENVSITSEGSCIVGQASNEIDFIRIKDRIMYRILGII